MSRSLPIVLIPGLNLTATLYHAQLPTLWQLGPVMLADHRHGGASLASIAAHILAQAPPRFALAGLSMGGYIAFEMLRQAPMRIERLALLDTTARPDTAEAAARRRERIALTREGRFEQVTREAYATLVHPRRVADGALRETVLQMGAASGAAAFIDQQSAILERPDARPLLAQISCPTLVLVGEADQLTPPEHAREMATGIPGARLLIVPDCGHLSPLEQPAQVSAALTQWLGD